MEFAASSKAVESSLAAAFAADIGGVAEVPASPKAVSEGRKEVELAKVSMKKTFLIDTGRIFMFEVLIC